MLDNNEIINYIKNNNLNLCIQILENNDTKYEKISEKKGVFSKIYNALNKIKENDILYSLVLLASKFNEDNVNQIFEKFKGFNIRLEFIYPIKNDFYSKKYVNLMYDKSKDFVKPSLCSFEKFSKYNNCYKNVLAVSCDGVLYPCIMSRKLCLGSIKDFNLCEALINSENEGYPFLCRNKIEGCKTCHKRYGCLDCRALEMSATEDNVYGMNFCALLKGYRHE